MGPWPSQDKALDFYSSEKKSNDPGFESPRVRHLSLLCFETLLVAPKLGYCCVFGVYVVAEVELSFTGCCLLWALLYGNYKSV